MMDLAEIEIDKQEAAERLAEYQQLVYEERTVEDEAIAAGYRAAARGLPIISMRRTIAAGGFHDDGFPKIAAVAATATACFAWWDGGDLVFADAPGRDNRGALVGKGTVRVQVAGDDVPHARKRGQWSAASTIVPIIPPRFRPRPRRLAHCHVLWEVEKWTREPPHDPALLRHIRGDLWAVLAVWDLTELERLVLSQR